MFMAEPISNEIGAAREEMWARMQPFVSIDMPTRLLYHRESYRMPLLHLMPSLALVMMGSRALALYNILRSCIFSPEVYFLLWSNAIISMFWIDCSYSQRGGLGRESLSSLLSMILAG